MLLPMLKLLPRSVCNGERGPQEGPIPKEVRERMKSGVRRLFVAALIALLGLGVLFGGALTQSQSQNVDVKLTFRNVCEEGTITIQQIAFTAGRSLDLSIVSIPIRPGQTAEFARTLPFVPERLGLSGTLDGRTFTVEFSPLPTERPVRDQGEVGGCLEVFAVLSGGGTQPPQPPSTQPGEKPIAPGMDLNQVLAALQARGFQIRQEGSQSDPKLRDLSDPMLLRAIPGFSVQLVWVGAPGTLRSVITWDNPAVDLDLLVFGFGACFQLTPPGVLAELCDRAPSAPVPGVVFAVVIINWSPLPQAYVLSLSP